MRIIGDRELPSQPKFGYVRLSEVTPESLKGYIHDQADVGPRSRVEVVPSGLTIAPLLPGNKCEHGVYIPKYAHDQNEDRAKYCTVCNPYVIQFQGADDEPTESSDTPVEAEPAV